MRFLAIAIATLVTLAGTQSPPTQHDGLTVSLDADTAAVTLGSSVVFHVSLRFDSTIAASNTRMLNLFSGTCAFLFVNDATGKVYRRPPYSAGMPEMEQPGNLVRLKHGGRLPFDDVTVHLLSWHGDQIPVGKYQVSVIYANDAGRRMEAVLNSGQRYNLRPYNGPWDIWTGSVLSSSISFTVMPASDATVEVSLPTTIETSTTLLPIQIGWRPAGPDTTIYVKPRPGFALGNRWKLYTVMDGDTICRFPCGLGLPDRRGWAFLEPNVSARIRSTEHAEFILRMDVFETSVQPQHLWDPRTGVFDVLWTGVARYELEIERR